MPSVPEKTSDVLVASGIKVSFPVESSYPKKPILAAEPLCHLNSIPLSLLSSDVGAVSPPRVRMGSSTVTTVEFTVVVVPLIVRFPVTTKLLLTVVVPPLDEPRLMLVVDPDTPPVPMFSVLVVALAVAPVAKLYVDAPVLAVNILTVWAAVAVFPIPSVVAAFTKSAVVAALNALTVVAVVLKTSKDVEPVVTDVVKEGLVPNTRTPEPVSSEITPARAEDVVAANCPSVPPVTAIVPD